MSIPVAYNLELIDAQYQRWKADPRQVSAEWRAFFEGFELAFGDSCTFEAVCDRRQVLLQARVEECIARHRELGHLLACLDPLASCAIDHPLLALDAFELSPEDLDRIFYTPSCSLWDEAPLREILGMLRETYCRSVGVEYSHLQDPEERGWLEERMESVRNRPHYSDDVRRGILRQICEATLFDQFLHARYLGQKRFSIQGAEVVIPMLRAMVDRASELGAREIVLGMAHRGRLNVQTNLLGRPFQEVFCEFEGSYDPDSLVGSGDVKYHKGYLGEVRTAAGQTVRTLLATNPSHLEAVDPVVEGIARGLQDLQGDRGREQVLPLLIHGDAAFAGQGVVFETLNLSQLDGYRTGGTIHLVINNQIGFTTLPQDARSTRYSTDGAKMLMVPIFHVHGENPEAAVHVMQLACDYRYRYGKDVVIDLVCYRRYGHNEGDEPYFTQPQMYARIKDRPLLMDLYAEVLQQDGVLSGSSFQDIKAAYTDTLDLAHREIHELVCPIPEDRFYASWSDYHGDSRVASASTGVEKDRLLTIAAKATTAPATVSVHPKLQRMLARRLDQIQAGEGIDWATAEMLAFGSLLTESIPIRLSGEDSRRGTFSQRHSTLVDMNSGAPHVPLNHLTEDQARFEAYDSMLSENGVLGFEYGYSLARPEALVLWEAQFGDFVNNAQVIIDQFIVSGESKWGRLSGLALLLPHGLEGQGPEHSSARIERFLQLCAEDNIQVCFPTTPAQYFHLLRRQATRSLRKPLVVLTPKSLLRHPSAVSRLVDLTDGGFQEVLRDTAVEGPPRVVLFCSGKIYYDLQEKRQAIQAFDHAIVRLEQFYPRPHDGMKEAIARCGRVEEWRWVQEEPENMGGWSFVGAWLESLVGSAVRYVGRPDASSPSTGYARVFKEEQEALLNAAFR